MDNGDGSPTVLDSTFSGNSGSGMRNVLSTPTVSNCTFSNNSAPSDGGGMYNLDSTATVSNCTFSGNSSSNGSAMYHAYGPLSAVSPTRVTSCVFSGNRATSTGTIYIATILPADAPIITNCTFVANTANSVSAVYSTGSYAPTLTNSIVWGNSPATGAVNGRNFVSYSDIQGGLAGTGNIAADPLFVDATGGDFRLQAGSPCIDVANGAAAPAADRNGNARVDIPNVGNDGSNYADMGAYEYQPLGGR